MKKSIVLGFILLVGVLVLIGCTNPSKDLNKLNNSEESILGVSVVKGINDIKLSSLMNMNVNNELSDENIDFVEDFEYLDLMVSFINDDSFKIEVLELNNELYEELLKVSINSEVYEFYYNEVLIKEEIEDDEVEAEYSIKGIIINNGIEFSVVGKKEVESEFEDNEREEEMTLELRISYDDNNYSIIKYEVETEQEDNNDELEKELKFTTYKNGKLVSKMNMDFELEDGKTKVSLKIRSNDKLFIYSFKESKKDIQSITYIIKDNNSIIEKGSIQVVITTNEDGVNVYQYIK